mmetsp:Transcript_105789/g.341279  ORF Transcript_105789/g.341279 Transcript_105789/m.341279 type:complete len:320 (+) Transcript_105789:50-1009(+)
MAPAAVIGTYDATRFGALHDVQYDYLGRKVATASADGVVRVWGAEKQDVQGELRGHRAPALTLSWGHGRFASTLASGAADGQVIVWREVKLGEWQAVHQLNVTGSVSVVAFCPPEYGLVLAVGGLDALGVLTVLTRREILASPVQPAGEQWQVTSFPAHDGGVVGLSWAPSTSAATLATGPAVNRAASHATRRLVTAGADGGICIWQGDGKTDHWKKQQDLVDEQHRGTVQDVAWRPNVGIPSSIIASCTQEGLVATWSQDMEGQPWRLRACWEAGGDARRVAWSQAGSLLAVSLGDDGSAIYKEGSGGQWELVSDAQE